MFNFFVNFAISLICISFMSSQPPEISAHSAKCATCKYDQMNYEAEGTVKCPMGDAGLGETPFRNTSVDDIEKSCCESSNPPPTCTCLPNNLPIEAHEMECTKNIDLLFSEKPKKMIDFASVQCRACGVIHPPNSNNVILHCYSCNKSDVWQEVLKKTGTFPVNFQSLKNNDLRIELAKSIIQFQGTQKVVRSSPDPLIL